METVDILVIGGGLAGAAAAIAAATLGARVALATAPISTAENRIETLPPHGVAVLRSLGVAGEFSADDFRLSSGITSVWGKPTPNENDALFNPFGASWIVQRNRFDRRLLDCAERRGVTLHRHAAVAGWQREARGGYSVELGLHRRMVRAAKIVDASGRRASFARANGAIVREFDELVAISARLPRHLKCLRRARPLIESVPDGWWFSIDDDTAIVATLISDTTTVRCFGGPYALWRAAIATAPYTAASLRNHEPATLRVVTASPCLTFPPAGDDWITAGDAAASWDPLSSQGMANALTGGLTCVRALAAGSGDALRAATQATADSFYDHLATRAAYYRQERRWCNQSFWRRRVLPNPHLRRKRREHDGNLRSPGESYGL